MFSAAGKKVRRDALIALCCCLTCWVKRYNTSPELEVISYSTLFGYFCLYSIFLHCPLNYLLEYNLMGLQGEHPIVVERRKTK